MRRYYWAAKAVSQLNQILLLNISERPAADRRAADADQRALLRARRLDRDRARRPLRERAARDPRDLPALPEDHRREGPVGAPLRALYNARHVMDSKFRNDPANHETFMRMLLQPYGITHAFRLMNQTSVLGRYLRVFRSIVGQMQHDLFHVYTVDQHILMVLRNVRRFFIAEHAHEYPFCSQLAAGWDKPWMLYVAALFHDIAKGRGGDHSTLGARDVARFASSTASRARIRSSIEFLGLRAPGDEPGGAEAGPERPRGDRRLRAPRGQRALPHGALPADGAPTSAAPRRACGMPRRASCSRTCTATPCARSAGACPIPTPRSSRASARRWCSWRCMPSASRRTRRCGTRWTWATSCATTPARSPWHAMQLSRFVPPKNVPIDLAAPPVVRAHLSPVGEGLQVGGLHARPAPDLFARICGYFDQSPRSASWTPRSTPRATAMRSTPSRW